MDRTMYANETNYVMRKGILTTFLFVLLGSILFPFHGLSQTISFASSGLQGESLNNPTSLQFGPDDRLYVSQQNGFIYAFDIVRNGPNDYTATSTETIDIIRTIPNHNEDGSLSSNGNRQVTGILVLGTAANPILYVTSSDPRIGGGGSGNSTGLDENSGVISRLTWNGASWDMVHLVRGLPRSEENHSLNGMQYDAANNRLFVAAGGNTNKGAPSNNFAYLPELAYSAAILTVDLTAIDAMPTQIDGQNQAYKYDLPTLDDEDKSNVANPTPGYEDPTDPWGGNDGKNQAMLVVGGPVQVYSSGWRNHYDVLYTSSNRLYTFDNGPNTGWGGIPINSCSNGSNEANSNSKCDNLHFVSGQGYYGGHPNPTRANRNNTFNTTNPQTPIPVGMEDPFCDYRDPVTQDGALAQVCSSTNGLCEYTASNFGGQLEGNLLAAAFNGNIVRFEMNGAGDQVLSQSNIFSGFGATPLDVIAQPDAGPFPGTVWACTYGADNITIFEPQDFVNCVGNDNSFVLDFDGDGYSNGDELANGTDQCSPASQPEDFDGDFVSDITDNDDDNDGILDNVDFFARDAANGTTTSIPVSYQFDNSIDPGINGWGFTGLMTDYTNDYMDLYDPFNMTVGGAALKFTVDSIPPGDALGPLNNQEYAFQFGVDVGSEVGPYTINGRIQGHFASQTPDDFQSYGFFIGTGDQDNYLKVTLASNGGAGGLEIVYEESGGGVGGIGAPVQTMFTDGGLLNSTFIDVFLTIDPSNNTVQPKYSIDGNTVSNLGSPITIPASWINSVLSVGVISTARGASGTFPKTYDFITIERETITATGNWVDIVPSSGSAQNRHENSWVQVGDKFYLVGGRGNKRVDIYDPVANTWTAGSTAPVEMHHFQAIEYEGNLWVVGAFTGGYPTETPLPNIYIYNPATDTWHVGPTIPATRRRGSAGIVVHNEEIYVVCGIQNGHQSGWVPWVDRYNPKTDTWTQLADAPIERDHYHAQVFNDKIYNAGGRRTGFGGQVFSPTVGQVDIYDIATNTWTTLAAANNIPTERAGSFAGVIGDEVIIVGGESGTQSAGHEETEAYSSVNDSWRSLDNMIDGRHGTSMISNNGVLYVAAGSGNRGGGPELNTIEAFSFFGLRPTLGSPIIASTLTSNPSSYDYGTVNVGNSDVQSFTISNAAGNQGIFITSLSFSGDPDWTSSFTGNLPYYLPAGDSITIDITYTPTQAGGRAGTYVVEHTGTANPLSISLIGGGFLDLGLYRINCNSTTHVDVNGNTFDPDNYFTGGSGTNNGGLAIANTADDPLYQFYRYNNFSYNFPLTDTGDYRLILHFSENWSGANGAGLRVFDVVAEGQVVLDDYDIWVEAGYQTAIQETIIVNVQDGSLDLQWVNGVQNSKVAAIEVIGPLTPGGAALVATPNPLHYFSQTVSTTSPSQDLNLANSGSPDSTLTITSIAIGGTHGGDFGFTSPTLPLNLAGGTNVNVPFTFTPTAVGLRSAYIVINHSSPTSPDTVVLTGEGVVPLFSATVNVINDIECVGDVDGSVWVDLTNGQYPYTYAWSNGGTTDTITGLGAGTYAVTVTDALNQTAIDSVTLSIDPLLVQVNACLENGLGVLSALPSGGQMPYTYLWDANAGSSVNDTVAGLAFGSYSVTITDANACTVVGNGTASASTPVCDTCALPSGWANQDIGNVAATGASCYNAANDTWYVDGSGNDIWSGSDEFQFAYTTLVGDGEVIARVTSITNTNQWAKAGVMMRESLAANSKNAMMLKRGANGWSYQWRPTDGANSQFSANTGTQILPLWVRIVRVGNDFTGYYSADGITWTQQGGTQTIAMAPTLNVGLAVTSHADGTINNSIFDNVQVIGASNLLATATVTSNYNGSDISCAGATDGSATVAATGGATPYTYLWDATAGSQTTATATGLAAGTYSVTVTDANSATAVTSITLTEPAVLATSTTVTDVDCNGASTGSATVSVTGGTAPYTYAWNAAASSQTTATASGLTAGTYTVVVTDANGCTATATATIIEPAAISLTTSAIDISCSGDVNGQATVAATGGTGSYTYFWDAAAGNQANATASGLGAGTYSVTVTDANNCTSTASVTITEPAALAMTLTPSVFNCGNISCNGAADGSITAAVTGGVGPYSYDWGNTIIRLNAGNQGAYTAGNGDVFAADNFATGGQFFNVGAGIANTTDDQLYQSERYGNVAYNIPVSNGAYQINLHFAEIFSGAQSIGARLFDVEIEGVLVLDDYDIFATAGFQTAVIETFNANVVDGSLDIVLTTVVDNAKISAIEVIGLGSPSLNGLSGGTYTVTVTDSNGCTLTDSVTMVEPAALVAAANLDQDESCIGSANGQATASAADGCTPYTYQWDVAAGSQTTATATGLVGGTYSVTVTDANGCTGIDSVTVASGAGITANASLDNDVSCNGLTDGQATASATGGTAPYTYLWDAAAGSQATATATGLAAGTYTVVVTDANGCTANASVTISETAAMVVTLTPSVYNCSFHVSCNGAVDGSITAATTGGTAPYTYNYGTGQTAIRINTGNQGAFTAQNGDVFGGDNAANRTIVQTPTGAYNNNNIVDVLGTNDDQLYRSERYATEMEYHIPVTNGTYELRLHFAEIFHGATGTPSQPGNIGDRIFNVDVEGAPFLTNYDLIAEVGTMTADIQTTIVNVTDDTLNVYFTTVVDNAKISAIEIVELTGANGTLNNIPAGSYTVTVIDANGCTTQQTIALTEPDVLVATATLDQDESCVGSANGSATATETGGCAPYSYQWDAAAGSQTTATATGLVGGNYAVTITDANGCSGTSNVTVATGAGISVTANLDNDVSCNGLADGQATASASGGTAPYTFLWDAGAGGQTTATASNLAGGTYSVNVTDANGCAGTASVTVAEPAALTASATSTDVICNGAADGTGTVTATGGTAAYTYLWDTGAGSQTTATATGLGAGTYTVVTTDANGCTATASVTIAEPAAISLTTAAIDVNCAGDADGEATVTAAGGTAPLTIQWDAAAGNQTTATAAGLVAGTYNVTVTDANGCTASASVTVGEPAAVAVSLTPSTFNCGFNVSCNAATDGSITAAATGGVGPYTYDWGGTAIRLNAGNQGAYTAVNGDVFAADNFATGGSFYNQNVAIANTNDPQLYRSERYGNVTYNIPVTNGTYQVNLHFAEIFGGAQSIGARLFDVNLEGTQVLDDYDIFATAGFRTAVIETFTATVTDGSLDIETITVVDNAKISAIEVVALGGPNQSNLGAGTYTVTVTDANGCSTTDSISLTEPATLTASASTASDITCNGANDGGISVAVAGGCAPYSYSWTGGAGTLASASNLAPGTYDVTVTDANGCTATSSVTLTEPAVLIATASESSAISTNGGSDGEATATATGGTTPYTYLWDANAGSQTTATATGLSGGIYSVTVTDANGCTATDTALVVDPAAPVVIQVNQTGAISCAGGSDGEATVSVIGGIAPYTYQWDAAAGNQITATATGLAAGTYSVTVTDNNGDSATGSVTLSDPAAIVLSSVASDATCNGGNDGSIDLTVSNGVAPVSYNWSNGAVSEDVSGLLAGTYTVVITDANGCTATTSASIGEPAAIQLSLTTTDASCNGQASGTVNLTVNNGVAPFSFNWSNGATTEDLSGVGVGTYSVVVTDANGCTANGSANVSAPASIVASVATTDVTCNGGSDGAADLTVNGGTIPYTYNWSNGAVTEDLNSVTVGSYTVTITDGNGCQEILTTTIGEPAAVQAVALGNAVSCNGAVDGSIDLTVSGSTAPVSYSWSNGATTEDVTGLGAGTYSVIVTDANGCTATASATITEPAALALTTSAVDASCNAGMDGSVDLTVTGGTAPYSYSWNTGATTQDLSGLIAGTYTAVVTDANGCTANVSATVAEPAALLLILQKVNITCTGAMDGGFNLFVVGGTPPLSYNWSHGAITQNVGGLGSGNYSVTVTDANGCTSTQVSSLLEPFPLGLNQVITNVSCNGLSDGAINITPSGGTGTGTYTYLWSNGATSQDISGVPAGNYSVTLNDANGCVEVGNYTVGEPGPLALSLIGTDATCNGGNDGAIDLTVNGGTAPFTYAWSTGATTEDLSGLSAGNYGVTVTDVNGCAFSDTISISEPSLIQASLAETDPSCNGATDGSIDLSVIGGTAPYTYLWSTTATTEDVNGIGAGTYMVTITDANNCSVTGSASLSDPSAITFSFVTTDLNCNGGTNGAIDLTVSGGTPPYTFNWSNGATSEDLNGLTAGVYSMTLSDANGCTVTGAATVSEPAAIAGSAVGTDATCLGASDGNIDLTVSGGTAPYTFNWSNGATTEDVSNLAGGTYSVAITGANGCTSSASATIAEPAALALSTTATDLLCNGDANGSIDLSVSGGSTPYTFSWNNGGTTEDLNGLGAGTYSVVVTDGNGCTGTATATVSEPAALTASASVTQPIACSGSASGEATVTGTGGTTGYTYLWDANANSQTTATATGLAAGTYSVTVTDANGCTSIASVTLQGGGAGGIVLAGVDISCNGLNDGQITASGGVGPYTYTVASPVSNLSLAVVNGNDDAEEQLSNGQVRRGRNNLRVAFANNNLGDQMIGLRFRNLSIPQGATITSADIQFTAERTNNTNPAGFVIAGEASDDATIFGTGTGNISSRPQTTANTNWAPAPWTVVGQSGADERTPDLSGIVQEIVNRAGWNTGNDMAFLISGPGRRWAWSFNGSASDAAVLNLSYTSAPVAFNNSNLAPGTYIVTATDANGCTGTDTIVITEPGAISLTTSATDITCNGDTDGSVDLSVSGGTPGYSFNWSNGATTEDLNNLSGGVYNVVVTDVNGCVANASATVVEPAVLVALAGETVPVTCANPSGGEAKANASGGTSPYTYQWDANANNQTTAVASGLSAGTYSVTITDANNCQATASVTLNPAVSAITLAGVDANCNGSSDGQILAAGGTAPYSYSITSSSSSITQPISNGLDDAEEDSNGTVRRGRNNLRLVYANQNQGNQTVGLRYQNVNIPQGATILSAQVQFTTENTNNINPSNLSISGEAVDNSAGFANSTFDLSTRANTSSSVNWAPANWSTLGQASANQETPDLSSIVQEIVNRAGWSSGNDMSLFLNGTGRRRAESFEGSASDAAVLSVEYTTTVSSNTNLPAGIYTVTVTDANGCTSSSTVTINEPAPIVVNPSNVSCNGGSDGEINASGGTGPLSIVVSAATPFSMSNQVAFGADDAEQRANGSTNLGNNDLELVFDGNNNGNQEVGVRFRNVNIPQGASITNAYIQFTAKNTGNLNPSNLTIFGEASDDAPVIQNATNNLSNRSVTSSAVLWSPANWTSAGQAGVNERTPNMSGIVQEIVNRGGWSSGNSMLFRITGQGRRRAFSYNGNQSGAPVLVVEWATTSPVSNTNLGVGTYFVKVTDANFCSVLDTIEITEPTLMVANAVNTVAASTPTSNDGEATANVTGGTPPYTYIWDPGTGSQTTQTATGLSTGIYQVKAVDANGCYSDDTVFVSAIAPPIAVTATVTSDILCNGDANGEATATISGGVPPFAYLWDANAGSQTTATATGLGAGTYTVTVTDALNNTAVATVTLIEPATIALNAQDPLCFGGNDGQVTATGGTQPYSYSVTLPPVTGTTSVQPGSGSDDCEQTLTSGAVNTNSSSLEMGFDNNNPNDPQLVGIRFPNLNIPQGATITSASLIFTAESTSSSTANLNIVAQDADDAATFSTGNNNVGGRSTTTATVAWNNAPAWTNGQTYTSPDLSAVVQEVIDRGGWASGNALAMIVSGTGFRNASSIESNPADAPILQINWSVIPNGNATSSPLASNDDAEQTLTSGAVNTNSSSLEMGFDNNDPSDPQLIGIRFPAVAIPQGATITSANIVFTSEANASGLSNLTFRGTASDNAAAFSTANNNVGSRPLTSSSMSWNVPNWVNGQSYSSPDMSAVVQEVVNRAGWNSGNNLAIVVNGTGFRNAAAYDAGPNDAPVLQVTWSQPFSNTAMNSGAYQVSVTDANGCTFSDLVTLNEPDQLLAVGVGASCGGTGLIHGDGGTAPYAITLVGGATSSTQITNGNDDAEQTLTSGAMNLSSSSLEIGWDGNNPADPQFVGVRFPGVNVPQGAVVQSAFITFNALSSQAGTASFNVYGEYADDAAPLNFSAGNLTNRPATPTSIAWNNVPAWTANISYATPDLTGAVQDIVDRGGWVDGNSMAFMLSGSGLREAKSFNASSSDAPILTVVYSVGSGNGTDTISGLPAGTYSVLIVDDNGCSNLDSVTINDECNPCANDRVTDGLIAYYPFVEGSGSLVHDLSGYGAPLDLTIADPGNVTWLSDNGVSVNSGTIISSGAPATKIANACGLTNEITVEAWVAPANTNQGGPARLVTMSDDPYNRNWTLGQEGNTYRGRVRTSTGNANGTPDLITNNGALSSNLQHVVMTRDAIGVWQIFVDGVVQAGNFRGGDFSNWNANWELALVNELTNDRDWLGDIKLVAIYNKALTTAEIQQNLAVGAGCEGNYPPVGFCTAEIDECANGLSVDFDASGSVDPDGQITSYSWDFGDGNSSTQTNPTHVYAAAGTYTVTLTVTDNTGLTGTCINPVTVNTTAAGRVTQNLIAYYTFTEGSGNTVYDYSGYQTPLNLTIDDPNNVSWVGGSAISVNSATTIHSVVAASKIQTACTQTNEVTVEAWVSPANTTQGGPSRLVSMSDDPYNRNWTLGVEGNDYISRIRTNTSAANGTPDLNGNNNAVTTNLQHVVFTRDISGAWIIYVDGNAVATGNRGGNLSTWDANFELALANELTNDRPWLGEMHLVAIYNDALSQAEIQQNFSVGPECEGALAPVAFCEADIQSCNGTLSAEFTGSNSVDPNGTITAYAWDFGDGNSSTQADPTHTYAAVGTYTATLTVTDNDGNTGTCTISVVANQYSRVTQDILAYYPFTEGVGNVVHDYSGVGTAVDLTIQDTNNVNWIGNDALSINSGVLINSVTPASKVHTACQSSNEITMEAWVVPDNTTQGGPSRIVTLSVNTNDRNWTLHQDGGDFGARLRTTSTGNNGLSDMNANNTVTTNMHHVVYTRASNGAYAVYVDGVLENSGTRGGNFSNWNSGYQLALANELTNNRDWLGDMHLVALYSRALTANEVTQNFNAGPDCDPQGMSNKEVAGAEAEVPGLDFGPTAEVFPNPFEGSFNFRFESPEDFQSVDVQIFDALGQKVFEQRYGSENGLIVKEVISLDGFTKGNYLMVVTSGEYRKSMSLIKY